MTEEIKNGNKLIAEFVLGLNWRENEYQCRGIDSKNYHNNWEWQIPAQSKIFKACFDKAEDSYTIENIDLIVDDYNANLLNENILMCFEILVESVKWLNEQKK